MFVIYCNDFTIFEKTLTSSVIVLALPMNFSRSFRIAMRIFFLQSYKTISREEIFDSILVIFEALVTLLQLLSFMTFEEILLVPTFFSAAPSPHSSTLILIFADDQSPSFPYQYSRFPHNLAFNNLN